MPHTVRHPGRTHAYVHGVPTSKVWPLSADPAFLFHSCFSFTTVLPVPVCTVPGTARTTNRDDTCTISEIRRFQYDYTSNRSHWPASSGTTFDWRFPSPASSIFCLGAKNNDLSEITVPYDRAKQHSKNNGTDSWLRIQMYYG